MAIAKLCLPALLGKPGNGGVERQDFYKQSDTPWMFCTAIRCYRSRDNFILSRLTGFQASWVLIIGGNNFHQRVCLELLMRSAGVVKSLIL